MTALTLPAAVPTTAAEALAFVTWCESDAGIGAGFHPDTSGDQYVTGGGDPLFTPEQAARFDEMLDAAHALLPDIYETSMDLFEQNHPELFEDDTESSASRQHYIDTGRYLKKAKN